MYLLARIVFPQIVMVPVALLSGRAADKRGRKPMWICAFSALVLRGVLFALGRNPDYTVRVEVLDGVGTGIAGVVTTLVVADLAQGTGRFNTLSGVMQACLGIGAFLGNLLAGMTAERVGFPPVFFGLAALALVGRLLLATAMPESEDLTCTTARREEADRHKAKTG